jgi:hypothetical protein
MKRAQFLCGAFALGLTVAGGDSAVAQSAEIIIGTPPPPLRVEPVPPARYGYAWAPGHWRWEGGVHVRVPGHWVQARAGERWETDRWVEVPNGRWRFVPGQWVRY